VTAAIIVVIGLAAVSSLLFLNSTGKQTVIIENQISTVTSPITEPLIVTIVSTVTTTISSNISSTNSSGAQSTISIEASCISIAAHCNGGTFYIILQNIGSITLSSGGVEQIYFQDITNPSTSTISCTLSSSLAPGSQITIGASSGCSVLTGGLPTVSAGDSISVKVVVADGGSATASTKVIS